MNKHQITHIRKTDVYSNHERITHVKYDGIVHPVIDVITDITSGRGTFYVQVGIYTTLVEVVRPFGRPAFIRTRPDSTGKDNLLSLTQC